MARARSRRAVRCFPKSARLKKAEHRDLKRSWRCFCQAAICFWKAAICELLPEGRDLLLEGCLEGRELLLEGRLEGCELLLEGRFCFSDAASFF